MHLTLRIPALPRIIIALAAVILATVLGATMASAQQSQPVTRDEDALTASDTTPEVGQTITVSGTGFAPGASVDITLEPGAVKLGSTTADATGAISALVTIPASISPGDYRLKASGAALGGGLTIIETSIVIHEAGGGSANTPSSTAGSPGETLPRTGSDIVRLSVLGLLVLAGGAALLVARGRITQR